MARLGVCGEFELVERLRLGGTAEIFFARPLGGDDPSDIFALKWALSSDTLHRGLVGSLVDEARIARSVRHPNICRVDGYGEEDGRLFIVMEFIHGQDLRGIVHRARELGEEVPHDISAAIVRQVANALDYAHNRGQSLGTPFQIIHRDINPQNIMVTYRGVTKVIDFGIAKAKGRTMQTSAGIVKGKSEYMAPEQARGHSLDHRVDIFAAGIVLYELCTGTRPFQGKDDDHRLLAAANCDFKPPRAVNPKLDKRLSRVIERAMQHNPKKRQQRGKELAAELTAYLDAVGFDASPNTLASYVERLFHDTRVETEAHLRALLRRERL